MAEAVRRAPWLHLPYVCYISMLLLGIAHADCRLENYQQKENSTSLFVGETVSLNFSVTCDGSSTSKVTLILQDQNAFNVTFDELTFSNNNDNDNDSVSEIMNVNVTGTQLIISQFTIVSIAVGDENQEPTTLLLYYVKVMRVPNRLAQIVRYLVTAAVVVTIWLIGVTTDVKIIIGILKRPFGIIIGMLCQFVIMPFTAWSLAKLFQIEGAAAVGLVLDGSCPGGTNSNLFSVLLDVDFVLSITMTFFSTVLALAMMPLNLLIYASSFTSAGEQIPTPFLDIFIQLLFLVIPVSIGVFLGWRWPKMRDVAEKYIKPVSALVVTVLICTDLPFNLFIFYSPWQYYCACVIFPMIGATAGFIISKVSRLTTKRAVTVAIETGVQNALIAVTVLGISYPQPEADLAIRLPYLILIFTTIQGISLVIVYTLLKKFYWHGVPYDDDNDDTETGQYDVSGDKKKETEQKEEPSRSSVFTISKNDADGNHKEDGFDVVDLGPKVTSAKTNSAYIVD
ncbi:putative ileal sodium/bile acid cotransporter [Apostichopus japonicus]|uniref:Putative ileal sodium/bile acid cotransporter n=1 Tax=Stichopus japonicus TaxID=307972 RepID=A0A2G8L0D3_STIJA|nr:putative ileal sodium/bile acid cotransporter [Apostichopus japonicus]